MKQAVLLTIAGAITITGVTLVVYIASGRGRPSSDIADPPPSPIPSTLPEELDTTPISDSVDSEIARARERVYSLAVSQNLSSTTDADPSAAQDIADAFSERLSAVIDPDYTRNRNARLKRGQPPVTPETEPPGWRADYAPFELASFDQESLEVRRVIAAGQWAAPHPFRDEGYKTTSSHPSGTSAFPIPNDVVASRTDVWEIRMAMRGLGPNLEDDDITLIGYQFVWSKDRKQWIPYKNVVYGKPGNIYYGVPF